MKIETSVEINAPKEAVWKVITDIDGASERISGILSIDVLERPQTGLVGLKWEEKRTLFGKDATEVMWITDAVENDHYKTRAESHGAIYISTLAVSEKDGVTTLTMGFEGEAQSVLAKLMSAITTPLFKKTMIKALDQDLADIKAAVEK